MTCNTEPNTNLPNASPALSAGAFQAIRQLIYSVAGIAMGEDKDQLVRARLLPRLRALKLSRYEQYLERVAADPQEMSNMVDVLTTNKTSFFREQQHFQFLIENEFPRWQKLKRPIRVWCAACSSGEEPYSVAMLVKDHVPTLDVKILATDISLRVLTKAKARVYSASEIGSIPVDLAKRYLKMEPGADGPCYRVERQVASYVSFARLNLMDEWTMRGEFDLILCRNVMIYFDSETRASLARRFADILAPDGRLFISHTESFAGLDQPLRSLQSAIYAR